MDYEALDAMLDNVVLDRTNWLTKLDKIRGMVDHACDIGALAHYQWSALVTRSSKIQDMFNEENGL